MIDLESTDANARSLANGTILMALLETLRDAEIIDETAIQGILQRSADHLSAHSNFDHFRKARGIITDKMLPAFGKPSA